MLNLCLIDNIIALSFGADVAEKSGFNVGSLAPPKPPEHDQIMITGNAALSLGATSAGLDSYYGYPISPATTVLVWMEQNLVQKGKFVFQVSSEIEAINNVVGAGFSGKKAMTATAGPGLSLMSEGIGLAWMAEIPCVVVDVQRGGPATGLPTKSEQSDLFASHLGQSEQHLIAAVAQAKRLGMEFGALNEFGDGLLDVTERINKEQSNIREKYNSKEIYFFIKI